MPYITQAERDTMADDKNWLNGAPTIDTPGKLNYVVTRLCQAYLLQNCERYQTYNDIVGVLESCKLELYRRRIAFYESVKCELNGDVW